MIFSSSAFYFSIKLLNRFLFLFNQRGQQKLRIMATSKLPLTLLLSFLVFLLVEADRDDLKVQLTIYLFIFFTFYSYLSLVVVLVANTLFSFFVTQISSNSSDSFLTPTISMNHMHVYFQSATTHDSDSIIIAKCIQENVICTPFFIICTPSFVLSYNLINKNYIIKMTMGA